MRYGYGMVLAAVACAALIGCGGPKDTLNRQAVVGEVTLKGEPLDTGAILFEPQDSANGTNGGAVITAGRFEISKQRGLPPGVYVVRVSSPDSAPVVLAEGEAPGDSSKVAKERVPKTWNVESEQTITVEAGGENKFELAIP
ncbi:hypothetical protein LOC68_24705 [Blastopirellula sp. JC732]|uniref:Carboxypeptidase regulatory-like domain-containing protein n=1 Tax=Blastopirellula sediminis TaxID=2894196 RepID=A0A9X1MSK0_9BACT|nr:hypothetical protein [Blastopirellula sediminis]MCC9605090.1 hypothetical protein [Blastopirellula sediminis]MCC9631610.1 hypothetical protein [Blastopirellula sediminis]